MFGITQFSITSSVMIFTSVNVSALSMFWCKNVARLGSMKYFWVQCLNVVVVIILEITWFNTLYFYTIQVYRIFCGWIDWEVWLNAAGWNISAGFVSARREAREHCKILSAHKKGGSSEADRWHRAQAALQVYNVIVILLFCFRHICRNCAKWALALSYLSVHVVQCGYHCTAFYEILSCTFLLKSFDQSWV